MADTKNWWRRMFSAGNRSSRRGAARRAAWRRSTPLQLELLETRLTPSSYNVAQIRAAYGINSIPNFGTTPADGTGQTIAVVDAYNDPYIFSDLDGFDQAMYLTPTSSQTLYQQYGAGSSFLSVFNQSGTNITANIANSGAKGVPTYDQTGAWEGETVLDVEWAHAIAPGAKIDLVETNDSSYLENGAQTAANLPGVSVVSNSWNAADEWSTETTQDDPTYFTTPAGHIGVTFLDATGDGGTPSGYPAYSPNVIAVGGTELTVTNNAYAGETGWSFPTPRTLNWGSSAYAPTGTWNSSAGGFSGTVGTAAGGSSGTATWTTNLTNNDFGSGGYTEVSATWVAAAGNATNATYSIYDGFVSAGDLLGTVAVDQTKAPVGTVDGGSQFQELGSYYSYYSKIIVVLNANTANGTVNADAIGIAPAAASSGGPSQFEVEPSYQESVQNSGVREVPDVSMEAGTSPGVQVYQGDYGGLVDGNGGTSLATPCWAGLIAIVNQGRVAAGGSVLNSPTNETQALQGLYSLPASDFNDITVGYNGYSCTTGYDMVTGLGSPIANLLVPALVNYGSTATLAFTTQPVSTTAGSSLGTVAVTDIQGGATPVVGTTVTITLSTGTLTGVTTAVTNGSGVATFNGLSVGTAGTYTLSATASGATTAMSSSFTITAPAPTVTAVNPNSGTTSGGTSVIITGTNFTGATAVKFGATAATSFTVNSASQITAVAPAETAGTVNITVTTTAGTSNVTASDDFTYTAPAPTITAVSTTTPAGTYTTGATIPITVTFSSPVVVTGTPPILTLNTTPGAVASYAGAPGGTLTTLAAFTGNNGEYPEGNLVEDGSGNLFGTTYSGGAGYGTVFEVAAGTHTLTTLATFNSTNGANPYAGRSRTQAATSSARPHTAARRTTVRCSRWQRALTP